MSIDKSIRADYAIQGGGPNYLGKQKMVKAPKKWKSSPDHEPAELAYITKKEKDILIDLNLYGSLKKGKPNRGPSGIISLQGDMGSIGGGSRNGGGGGGEGPQGPPSIISRPAPTVSRVSPQQSMAMTGNTSLAGKTQEQAQASVDSDNAIRAAEGKIDIGFQEALKKTEDIRQREQDFLETGDYDVFADTRLQPGPKVDVKDIMGEVTDPDSVSYDPTYKTPAEIRTLSQDPNYGQFFRPQPVVEKPKSGILKTLGKGILETALMPFLPKPVRTAWQAKKRYDALQKSALGQKLGLKEFDVSNLTSTIDKAAKLRSRPKGMPEHLGERGFRTRDDTPTRDGDGANIQQAITGEKGLLTEGAETLGITADQRKQYLLIQNKMKMALDQGSYTNEQGQVIQLNDQQLDQLQNYIDKLNNILGTVLQTAAHGGRIDGPLMGGSRYI